MNMYKIKKNILIILLNLCFVNLIALDKEFVIETIEEIDEKDIAYIEDLYFFNNDYCIVLLDYSKNNNQLIEKYAVYIINENGFRYDIIEKSNIEFSLKYIIKLKNVDFFVGDFNFDEKFDFIYTFISAQNNNIVYNIQDLTLDKYNNRQLLKILFPNSEDGNLKKINSRLDKRYYLKMSDFEFCIINGKRGIKVYTIGNIIKNSNLYTYDLLINNTYESNYLFFYWSKENQCYILDESVTQSQIKNAIIPEDYFAYNGLKFSSLDKKLKKSDLENLDAAQLRLMRNAVYARYGRIFKSVDLQSLWECYTWYKANPNYSDDMLTEIDKFNIKLIQEFESKKKQ